MVPLRMALWQRDREGHPVVPGELIKHSDAGSQYTSVRLTEPWPCKVSGPPSAPWVMPTRTP